MPTLETISDSNRTVSYAATASTGPFDFPFVVFNSDDVQVFLDGTETLNFTFAGTASTTDPSTYSSAEITLDEAYTGTVLLRSNIRPRRTSAMREGVGIPAATFNLEFNRIAAMIRDLWERVADLESSGADGILTQISIDENTTLDDTYRGKAILVDPGSGTITVTLHSDAIVGTVIPILQVSNGTVTIEAEAGGDVYNPYDAYDLFALGSVALAWCYANSGGSAAQWALSGDTA